MHIFHDWVYNNFQSYAYTTANSSKEKLRSEFFSRRCIKCNLKEERFIDSLGLRDWYRIENE